MQPEVHERLCPTSSVPVSVVNMSVAQRRLQTIGGVMFFNKLREAVWSGMKVSPRNGGVWVDMLGYDGSFVKVCPHRQYEDTPKSAKGDGGHDSADSGR